MSQTYSVEVSAEAQAIVRNLKDPSVIIPAVCAVLDQQNELTTGYIQEHMLSGPGKKDLSTLAVQTGLLRRSAHPVKAKNYGGIILSGIGSNVIYAGSHEKGVDKEVKVKEHQRRNVFADTFDYHGTAVNRVTALRGGILSRKQVSQAAQDSGKYAFRSRKAKQLSTGGTITVKAHSMHMNLPARRCFARGIEARIAEYGPALSAAIIRVWGTKP
jgi:hypothetical protein